MKVKMDNYSKNKWSVVKNSFLLNFARIWHLITWLSIRQPLILLLAHILQIGLLTSLDFFTLYFLLRIFNSLHKDPNQINFNLLPEFALILLYTNWLQIRISYWVGCIFIKCWFLIWVILLHYWIDILFWHLEEYFLSMWSYLY